ncbi:MAG: LON peptidase substrate-binding domain-containing protein, partial [Erysipelotrichaceae bacterium]|nr:LON peptidase substrate-binding domain-containing protein [Erysipelotrichaceae bacterium]
MEKNIPLLCTRGALIFPGQELTVEVGREVSVNAVNHAIRENTKVFVVSQIDLEAEYPERSNIYEYGTLCDIK